MSSGTISVAMRGSLRINIIKMIVLSMFGRISPVLGVVNGERSINLTLRVKMPTRRKKTISINPITTIKPTNANPTIKNNTNPTTMITASTEFDVYATMRQFINLSIRCAWSGGIKLHALSLFSKENIFLSILPYLFGRSCS